MRLISHLLYLFGRGERRVIICLAVMSLGGSLLEVAGIGLLFPFLGIAGEPRRALDMPFIGEFLRNCGVNAPKEIIVVAGCALLAVFAFRAIYQVVQWRVVYGFIYKSMVKLTARLLRSYLKCPFTFHLQRNTADLIRNTNIEASTVSGVLNVFLMLFGESMVLIGLVTVLMIAEPILSLSALLVLGTVGLSVSLVCRRRLIALGEIRLKEQGRMIQCVNQSLGALKEIKVLNRGGHFIHQLEESGNRFAAAQLQSTLYTQYPRLVIETTAIASIISLVVAFASLDRSMQELMPVFVLICAATVRTVPSVTRIISAVNTLRYHAASIDAVATDLRTLESQSTDRRPAIFEAAAEFNCLDIDELTYRYPSAEKPSLDNVSLRVVRGQSVAIVGSSGAGKTTLANLILGLLTPTSGLISVDGVDVTEDVAGWQRRLGYIPQDIYLTDDTIRRNVAFGVPDDQINDEAVWESLQSAQIDSFVRGLDNQLDAMVGERGVRISAGQRQRIGIARALYHKPLLLVLDEATSALDYKTEREMGGAIRELAKSTTMIIIAHRLNAIRNCDVIYVMDQGEVVGAGKYDELMDSNDAFQQLVSSSTVMSQVTLT